MATIEVVAIIVIWLFSIRTSHKMVGPVYAFGRELEKLSTGDLTAQIKLRPDDEFQEAAEIINAGVSYIRLQVHEAKELAATLVTEPAPDKIEELKFHLDLLKT